MWLFTLVCSDLIGWTHEEGSEMMLEALVKELGDDAYTADDVQIIKDMIRGRSDLPHQQEFYTGKMFLFQIVANSVTGLDVDKFDYIARDSHHAGVRSLCDTSRLMTFVRVHDGALCYASKIGFSLYEVFYTRYSLHKRCYSHRAVNAVEIMIADALVAAEDELKLLDAVRSPTAFVKLTDAIVERVTMSSSPGLIASQRLLERIGRRDLYRLAAEVTMRESIWREHKTKKLADDFYRDIVRCGHVDSREDGSFGWFLSCLQEIKLNVVISLFVYV